MSAALWITIGFSIVPASMCVAFYISLFPEVLVDLWLFFASWYVQWALLEVQA